MKSKLLVVAIVLVLLYTGGYLIFRQAHIQNIGRIVGAPPALFVDPFKRSEQIWFHIFKLAFYVDKQLTGIVRVDFPNPL